LTIACVPPPWDEDGHRGCADHIPVIDEKVSQLVQQLRARPVARQHIVFPCGLSRRAEQLRFMEANQGSAVDAAGSPMAEVLSACWDKITHSTILDRLNLKRLNII
jgi:hypothetical protein